MKWNSHKLAALTDGTLYIVGPDNSLIAPAQDAATPGADERDFSFSIDTRTIQAGQIFVALQGEQADGHAYLGQAFQKGASGAIISNLESLSRPEILSALSQSDTTSKPFVVHVPEPLQTLQVIAHTNRQKHLIPVIGVTGSNGKTTVKDMAASILATQFSVLKSYKSFNNHIGLPLTLANMTEQHDVAVLEMGMNAPGELTHLAEIAQPNIGVITNIAPAHFGFFHSIEAIMQAKMELIRSLPAKAIAVLNADDALFEAMRQQVSCSLVTFGLSDRAAASTIAARNIHAAQDATYTFDLETPDGSINVTLPIPGWHNVHNALAATAILHALTQTDAYQRIASQHTGFLTLDMIKKGLEQFQASPMRMQVISHRGVTFLNDAYNANPNSMAAALRTLKSVACSGKKVAVLGDMLELGEISASAHYDAGALAADVPVDYLFLLGEYAEDIARGAKEAGMLSEDIAIGESHATLAAMLTDTVTAGDIVLVKASRCMALERILDEYMTTCGET